jgi:hypothetical protein
MSGTVSEKDFADLKNRLKLIFDADPDQYHNDHSLRRYLKAFKSVDAAFQVAVILRCTSQMKYDQIFLL